MKLLSITTALLALFAAATANAQIDPNAGPRTWVVTDLGEYQSPAPPSDAHTQDEAATLKSLAAQRDDSAVALVRFWNAGAPAYRWIQIAQQEIANHNLGGPAATRAMSLVAVAMNDATVAAWASKYAYNRPRPAKVDPAIVPLIDTPTSPSYPSEYSATAAAASSVLACLFPDRKSALDSMAAAAGISRLYAGTEFPSDVDAGAALGSAVAGEVIAWAKGDGSDAVFTGSFPQKTGVWSSPTPSFPLAGRWKPWALDSGSQLRLPPPPAFGSADFSAQINGVKNFARTVQTNHIAWFWQPSFIDPWIDTTNQMLFENHIDSDPPRAAAIYALVTAAQHDATIACWDTKYAYLEARPVQADSAIQTLFPTPAHPSYPSGHACASAAAAVALSEAFPNASDILSAKALEAGLSTFYAGIHYRKDVDQGLALGQGVAQVVVSRAGVSPAQLQKAVK